MINEEVPDPSREEVDRYISGLRSLDRELSERARAQRREGAGRPALATDPKEPDPDFIEQSWRRITERMERNGYELIYDGPESIEEGKMTFPPSVELSMFILGKRKMIFMKNLK